MHTFAPTRSSRFAEGVRCHRTVVAIGRRIGRGNPDPRLVRTVGLHPVERQRHHQLVLEQEERRTPHHRLLGRQAMWHVRAPGVLVPGSDRENLQRRPGRTADRLKHALSATATSCEYAERRSSR